MQNIAGDFPKTERNVGVKLRENGILPIFTIK